MSRLLVSVVLLGFLVASAVAESPKPGPAHAKLKEYFGGDMTYEGEVDNAWEGTDYGPVGEFEGVSKTSVVFDGFFLYEKWNERYASGDTLGGITIFGYDSKNKKHYAENFWSNVTRNYSEIFFEGDKVTQQFKQTNAKGEESLAKGVWEYNDDKTEFVSTWELSFDNGKTWKHWLKYRGKKSK